MQGEDTPYKDLLRAGSLRAEAGRLAMRADHLEMGVNIALQLDATAPLTQTLMPGTMLVIAHGGEVDGKAERIAQDALGRLELVVPMSFKDGEIGSSRLVPYEPLAIIAIGPHPAGALVVPRGTRAEVFRELRQDPGDGPIMQAIARVIHLGIGYNTEMITGVAETFRKSAQAVANDDIADAPMFMQIKGAQ